MFNQPKEVHNLLGCRRNLFVWKACVIVQGFEELFFCRWLGEKTVECLQRSLEITKYVAESGRRCFPWRCRHDWELSEENPVILIGK